MAVIRGRNDDFSRARENNADDDAEGSFIGEIKRSWDVKPDDTMLETVRKDGCTLHGLQNNLPTHEHAIDIPSLLPPTSPLLLTAISNPFNLAASSVSSSPTSSPPQHCEHVSFQFWLVLRRLHGQFRSNQLFLDLSSLKFSQLPAGE